MHASASGPPQDETGHEFGVAASPHIASIRYKRPGNRHLLRKCVPILFCPVAIWWHGLHWWSAFCAARAWTLHSSFSHAWTRFCLQTSADV